MKNMKKISCIKQESELDLCGEPEDLTEEMKAILDCEEDIYQKILLRLKENGFQFKSKD